MKKTIIPFALLALSALAGCGTTEQGGDNFVPADPLDLGSEFNAEYYPNKENNKVATITGGNKMKIDVALDYDGTEEAWEELAKEYERLCGGVVDVNIIADLDTASYTEKLRNEEENPRSDWDVVQGNLLNRASQRCENLRSTILSQKNPYAGNKQWVDLIDEAAYITDVTGATETTYLLNTESLSTAWFINTKAATKAGIEDLVPETWDELIEMLEKLQEAGYKYPLGLALNSDSINNSQFSWLLRIYGDYYFRQAYQYTSKTFDSRTQTDSKFVYKKDAENQEADSTFSFSYNRGLCIMLDEECPYYMGPLGDVYKDFVTQLSRLGKYVRPSAYSQSFNEVRTSFAAQKDGNNGDEAPQIMLDYAGSGLSFNTVGELKNSIDFFDYPTIESDFVEKGTLTRDVGGNGGYLALFRQASTEQTELNKDFLKFVLSPYGQTIYYRALSEGGRSPKGLTTVKNDLVVIPQEWKEFFQTDKIKFTGLSDSNLMIGLGVMSFQKTSKSELASVGLWQGVLSTSSNKITVDKFGEEWETTLKSNWPTVAQSHNWKEDSWQYSNFANPNYIDA